MTTQPTVVGGGVDIAALLKILAGLQQPAAPAPPPVALPPGLAVPPPNLLATLMPQLLMLLMPMLVTYIMKAMERKPPVPVDGGGNATRLPDDDVILPPTAPAQPTTPAGPQSLAGYRVVARLQKAQYNRGLFPEMYTKEQNPEGWQLGLYKQSDLRLIEQGKATMSRSSKFWHDLTLRDASGKEMHKEDLVRLGVAFRTEHHAYSGGGHTRVIGVGGDGAVAKPGYEMTDEGFIGSGQQAWNDSVGMNLQFKAFGEGEVRLTGSVAGIEANELKFTVS
jgi:hypothetical protein